MSVSKMPAWRLSSAAFMALLPLVLLGAANAGNTQRIRFEHLGLKEGLSQGLVQAILQDNDGFMWFGTQDGLNRYDGYQFEIFKFDSDDPTSIGDSLIHCLQQDHTGGIWVGTRAGLNRFDPLSETFTRFNHEPANPASLVFDTVWTLYEDRQGNLWVGTWGGLDRYQRAEGRFVHYVPDPTRADSLSDTRVLCILEDRAGAIWVGTGNGLNRLDPLTGAFTRYQPDPERPDSLPHNVVYKIIEDENGILWLGTRAGLCRFDPVSEQFQNFGSVPDDPSTLSHPFATSLLLDNQGFIWVGTWNGVNRFDRAGGTFLRAMHDPSDPRTISHDEIWSIFQDHAGLIWIGTRGGLNLFNQTSQVFHQYVQDPLDPGSIGSNDVWTFYEDRQGELWVGHRDGLDRLDREKRRIATYVHDPGDERSLTSGDVVSLFEDRSGYLWVGTNEGLNRFDPASGRAKRYQVIADPGSEISEAIWATIQDDAGDLWFASWEGLKRYDPNGDRIIGAGDLPGFPPGLNDDALFCLYRDGEGILWLGTQSSGLKRFDPERRKLEDYAHFNGQPGTISHNQILCVNEDRRGTLWIGTNGGGLNRFVPETGRFVNVREKDGLPNDVIYGVLPDEDGRLWISTNRGVCRFDPERMQFRNYGINDGLLASEFNQGAALRTSQGEILFGSANGFNAFFPDRVRDNDHVPPVALTDFKLFNQTVVVGPRGKSPLQQAIGHTDEIVLGYRASVISFEFAALDFMDPQKNRYAYQLQGFNDGWVATDATRRFATYTNLNAGRYVFRVKGSNNDGLWNDEETSVRLEILPPPWKTWWAYLLYALLLIGTVFWYVWSQRVKLRTARRVNEQLRQVDKLKDEFLANTSHELRTPLNGIIGIAESLVSGSLDQLPRQQVLDNLSMIVSSGKRLASHVNDLLDYEKLKQKELDLQWELVDIHKLTELVLKLLQPLLEGRDVQLRNEVDPEHPQVRADENRVWQIMHNLVGNAMKFTESGHVAVRSKLVDDRLEIAVSDTGIGIPGDQHQRIFNAFEQVDGSAVRMRDGTGLGLTITKRLVELHGGTITLDSAPGEGSCFRFSLPISSEPKPQLPEPVSESFKPLPAEVPATKFETAGPVGKGDFHVLIVDDNPVNLQVLENHLNLQGHRVSKAHNGQEALNLVRAGHIYDLIILDVMMPRLSGYEVCRAIRDRFSLYELPVLMLTAKTGVEAMVEGMESGANDYLVKPFNRDELLIRAKTLLSLTRLTQSNRVLKEANELKAQLIGMTAHDLKNPLFGIMMGAQTLQRITRANPEIIEMADEIYHSSKGLIGFVNELLDSVALDQGRLAIFPQPVDINAVVEEVAAKFTRSLARKKQTLVLHKEPQGACLAMVDRKRIYQVMENLVSNAVKFSDYHKNISLVVRRASGDSQMKVRIEVVDEGPGILPEEREELFQKFKCLSARPTGGEMSSGLGLAIVKQLVELQDGRVWVESQVGAGSTFIVELPAT